MGYNQRYKSINLCPEPCGSAGGTWGRWLNIVNGPFPSFDVTDNPPTSFFTQLITTTIQPDNGQWILRGNYIVVDDIGAGAGLEFSFDFGGNIYNATIDIPGGESTNQCEFSIIVDDLGESARLTRLISWVRGRTGGTEPVEISMPALPLGSVPKPPYIFEISGICTTGDCIFTPYFMLGENFTPFV